MSRVPQPSCPNVTDRSDHARAAALRWEVGGGAQDITELIPTDGTRFGVRFRRVSEEKVGRNRIHLDLTATSPDDQSGTVSELIELGARNVDVGQTGDEIHVVLADPEGNELCIIEPGNNFLATCGRFGSITCDGSPAVGYFWSEALGWPLVWDQDGETAIRAPDGTGPFITWGPSEPAATVRSRLHVLLAPVGSGDQRAEVDRLVTLGATHVGRHGEDAGPVLMADPEGSEFRVLRSSG